MFDDFEVGLELGIQDINGCRVTVEPTIISDAAYCGYCFLLVHAEPIVNYFMSSADHGKPVLFYELLNCILIKGVAEASLVFRPHQ